MIRFTFIKCIEFRFLKKNETLLHTFLQKLRNTVQYIKDTSTGVYRIPCGDCAQCYIGETKRALTLRLSEHEANCRKQRLREHEPDYHEQHSAVVEHSAIGHSWGFNRAVIINTQRNTIKRKIAESLFIKSHSTVDNNKSSFPLSIFKL